MMDLFFCHSATFFINLGKNWLILKPCLTAALEVNLYADFYNRTLQMSQYFSLYFSAAAELSQQDALSMVTLLNRASS